MRCVFVLYVTVIPLVAGRVRHVCFYLQLADVMALTRFDPYDPAYCEWVMHDLRRASQPAKALGDYIKQVNEHNHLYRYKDKGVAAKGLPEGANAASIRPGACTTLFSQMPDNMAIAMTGHDMTGFSKYHEYVDTTVANCMVAAMVLAWWPSPGWGERSTGPRPASLVAIIQRGVTLQCLDQMIDDLFQFHSASPPMLLRDGILRELPRTCFATLIMYHVERRQAGEMTTVQAELYDVAKMHFPSHDPVAVMDSWATYVRQAFARDNVHLTAREEDQATRAFAKCLADLGQQVGEVTEKLGAFVLQQAQQAGELTERIGTFVLQQMADLTLVRDGDGDGGANMASEDNNAALMTILEEPNGARSDVSTGAASVGVSVAPSVAVSVGAPAAVSVGAGGSALATLMRTPAHVANVPGGGAQHELRRRHDLLSEDHGEGGRAGHEGNREARGVATPSCNENI